MWSCTSIPPCPNGIKRDKVTFTLILEENTTSIFRTGRRFLQKVSTRLQTKGVISQKAVVLAFSVKITQKFMHT